MNQKPIKLIFEGKKLVFFIEQVYMKKIGHLYDVCCGIDCSLYEFIDNKMEYMSNGPYIEIEEIGKLKEKKQIIPYFEHKKLEIDTDNIDPLKFKGFNSLTDFDIFNFIKDQTIDVVGKEIWETH